MTKDQLKKARELLGYIQDEMSEALAMSTGFISMMERGIKPISKSTSMKVERLLIKKKIPLSSVIRISSVYGSRILTEDEYNKEVADIKEFLLRPRLN